MPMSVWRTPPACKLASAALRQFEYAGICQSSHRFIGGRSQVATSKRLFSSSLPRSSDIYDVVIIGGGPNGLALVNAIRSNPITQRLRLALVESQDLQKGAKLPENPQTFSNRCSSLTPASVFFLDQIGAWEHVEQSRVQPFTHMNVWDGISGQQLHFDWAEAQGGPSLAALLPFLSSPEQGSKNRRSSDFRTIATMTENANIVRALCHRIEELGDIDVLDNKAVTSIDLGTSQHDQASHDLSSWPVVSLSDGSKLTARLLVGADGGNSPVRRFADIESRGWDYKRMGVVATVRLDQETGFVNDTAYQRFLPTGPCALLPLPGAYASLVWSTTPEHAAHLKSLSSEDFVAMVNAAFRLGTVDISFMHTQASGQVDELNWRLQHTNFDDTVVPRTVTGLQERSVAGFPLKMRHADTYIGERIALVGDAAHTIHPLAGQGLNSGLADVKSLAVTIADAVQHGADIGSTISLEPYNSARYTANHVLLGAVDKLHKIYSFQSGPIVTARSWGLGVVEGWGALKGAFMRNAGSA